MNLKQELVEKSNKILEDKEFLQLEDIVIDKVVGSEVVGGYQYIRTVYLEDMGTTYILEFVAGRDDKEIYRHYKKYCFKTNDLKEFISNIK